MADCVLASVEEVVHCGAYRSDAPFILGTTLQTFTIEHSIYKQ
jgi:hypothetical protein